MGQKSGVAAFVLWLLGLVGLCGLHRFYVGRVGTGILWLFTLGLLGVGQLFDLFFLGSMVRNANMLAALRANTAVANANVHNVVNVTLHAPHGYSLLPGATPIALDATGQPRQLAAPTTQALPQHQPSKV